MPRRETFAGRAPLRPGRCRRSPSTRSTRSAPSAPVPPGGAAAATPAENACTAKSPTSRLYPLAPPLPERRTHPLADLLAGVGALLDAPAQHRHHRSGQAGRGLLHRTVRRDRSRRHPGERRSRRRRRRPGDPAPPDVNVDRCRSSGPSSASPARFGRAAQHVEQPVLIVPQGPLYVARELRRDRREELVAPGRSARGRAASSARRPRAGSASSAASSVAAPSPASAARPVRRCLVRRRRRWPPGCGRTARPPRASAPPRGRISPSSAAAPPASVLGHVPGQVQPGLVPRGQGGGAGVVVGALQLAQDPVHRVRAPPGWTRPSRRGPPAAAQSGSTAPAGGRPGRP